MFNSCSTPGILYCLDKIHKSGCPARPMLSAIGTYHYKIAKFLVSILQHLAPEPYPVKDSFSFVKEFASHRIDSYCVMASFDVHSPFTKALSEFVNHCCDLLF